MVVKTYIVQSAVTKYIFYSPVQLTEMSVGNQILGCWGWVFARMKTMPHTLIGHPDQVKQS